MTLKPKRILLLNLPHKRKIMRTYLCSYFTDFLSPPYELLNWASELREYGLRVSIIDAPADGLSLDETLEKVIHLTPEIIISMAGFESIEEDFLTHRSLRKSFPNALYFLGGYYPTLFPEDALRVSEADSIIIGNQISPVANFLDDSPGSLVRASADIPSGLYNGEYLSLSGKLIIPSATDSLPAYDLININNYQEPLSPSPHAVVETRSGCRGSCFFCIKSKSPQVSDKSVEEIISEISYLTETFKVRSIRFLDNNFAADIRKLSKLLDSMILERFEGLQWSCMTRVDTLTKEVILKMKKAGCRRIYFGVESASPEMLKVLNKRMDIEKALSILKYCNKLGITTVGFFLMGIPGESYKDIRYNLEFAKKSKLSFVNSGELKPYPGTEIFNKSEGSIEFSLFPYKLEFRNNGKRSYELKERIFYRSFYCSFRFLFSNAKFLLGCPSKFLYLASRAATYLITSRYNIFIDLQ